jgi:hypothetical protein
MGSLFQSKSTAVSDPVSKQAFQTVLPALQTGVTGSIDLFNRYNANPAYTGQRVAGLNPFQTGSANTLGDFAQGFTPNATNAASNLGFSNIGAGMGFGSNAQDIFSRASMDPTQQIIDQAGQFADNPYTQGMIDAASRDVTRNLFENQLPGIDRAAVGGGNLNSTRAGVESAIAQRGAADRLADLSSDIRGKFFGQGLGMAQNQFNQNLQNMMASNQDLMRAGQFGMDALAGTQNMANVGFGQGQMAGGLFQNQNQAELDANKAVFDESLANRLATLGPLFGASQAGQGFRSVAGVTQQPSIVSQIGGLMQGAGAMAKGFGWSDIRMKQNIKVIGALESGLPVYSFEYKPEFKDIAGHGPFVGVMAHEVEQLIPEAVGVASNGYKYVDYAKVR